MESNFNCAIEIVRSGLSPERPFRYKQADALVGILVYCLHEFLTQGQLIFELAWMSFGERRYGEAGDLFLRMTKANNWSHATYLYIAGSK